MNTLKDIDQNVEATETTEEASKTDTTAEEEDLFTKKPTLPSWLLDVDKELEKFKKNYSEYKKGYDNLTNKLSVFTEKQKKDKRDYLMNKYFKHQLEAQMEASKCHLYDLSKYLLLEIAKYISKDYAPELFKLSKVNSAMYAKLKDTNLWMMVVQDYFGRAFVEANQKNVTAFEADEKNVAARLEKKHSINSKSSLKPVVPKYPHMSHVHHSPQKNENRKSVVRRDEFYWETIFKNIHARLKLTRETFKTLYDSKFPKNNDYTLLNNDINKSLCFIIEIFSTIGTFEYNEKLRILDLIKDMVMDQKSLLALIRLCSNDNGVIKINSMTVIFILLGYFRDLKHSFLQFAPFTLIQRLETIDKEFNISMFAVNISDFELCIIPDIAGYGIFFRDVISKLGCRTQMNFENSFPRRLPFDKTEWKGGYLTPKGQVTQPFDANIIFDLEYGTIEGVIEYYTQREGEEHERKVVEKLRGKLNLKLINQKIQNMNTPNPMKSFREVISKVEIHDGVNMEEEYELGLDIALSISNDGWYACLHGCNLVNKIFACYQSMSD